MKTILIVSEIIIIVVVVFIIVFDFVIAVVVSVNIVVNGVVIFIIVGVRHLQSMFRIRLEIKKGFIFVAVFVVVDYTWGHRGGGWPQPSPLCWGVFVGYWNVHKFMSR